MSTQIGKVLVTIITCASLLFLGVSTVAYSTARDWRKTVTTEQGKLDALKKKLQSVQQDIDVAKKVVDDAKSALNTETKALKARLASLQEENTRDTDSAASVKVQLASAEAAASKLLQDIQVKREQIDELHKQQSAVDQQTKEYRAHRVQLSDLIRELERLLQAAAKNKSDILRRRPNARLSAIVHENN
jgi:chromosome segregation ATPase